MQRSDYSIKPGIADVTHTAMTAPDSEWSTIVNALRTAAVEYDKIGGAFPILKEQMWKQRDDALRLADKIAEEAGV